MNFKKATRRHVVYKKGRSILLVVVVSTTLIVTTAGLLIGNFNNSSAGPQTISKQNKPSGAQVMPQGNNHKPAVKHDEPKLKISPLSLMQLGAFGLIIIALATSLSSINILKIEPRKFLVA
ncbi:hypothetical protein Q2T76_06405 [Lactobacillus sp. YT155]|uniref:hypothetical protein n=1 Tax=Lactobacillus sp. YT155 TaxID=3060955 RepID=UPI00265EE06F|nr:hypothetical protein [Lactobacillus sp. YT155]MDO1605688.1 hypothetical protein [Lactobacillus sp. YT155]